ncbi:glycosyltransferase family 2 protein [Megasphaera vaginalis (ex Bordigoni et al. 2020)]|uniref:glycosyltransferase family 2 protein n=1 Tax=Megasphaera vaginalis (ex Bordigoni et al. 2020) TaxID=2045301 RepID=UPI00190E9141|nr:glycosyltransferase family 2 protein [Megasphaera vaginalis (ex Bordigoni et al. 2020)]
MSTLSVLILTKNEEENMTAVIGSARQCTSDIIVVDAGSTDGTVAMAKACGARVIYHEWENDFAKQRNIARDSSTADWILYLDADERIDVKLAEEIRQVVEADDQSKQYGMKRKSVAFGKKFTYGVLYPDTVMRLFPRQSVVWVNKVHERPDCVLTAKILSGYMEHHTYKNWQQWEKKLCLYTTAWAENAFENGKTISKSGILGHALGGFFKMFMLRRGFLDGWMGTYMCFNHFFYELLKYLKLYELNHEKENRGIIDKTENSDQGDA